MLTKLKGNERIMPSELRYLLDILRFEPPSPRAFDRIMREIITYFRHGDFDIYDPEEIEELAHFLEVAYKRGYFSRSHLRRLTEELMYSISKSKFLPASIQKELHYRLMRALEGPHDLFLEGEEDEEDARIKKEEEEKKKTIQSIEKIKLNEDDRVLFFIGAGASKPEPSNIPTVNELLQELWKKSARMETKPLEKLQKWCEDNNIENIEEMLTAVTISNFIIKNSKVHGLLNSVLYPEWPKIKEISIRDIDAVLLLENMLNTFFSLLVGTMLQAKPNVIHKAIAEYSKQNSQRVEILTTNYDACIDQAFDELNVDYNYLLNSPETTASIDLVKMHGSINWFYCDTCQNVYLPSIETILIAVEQGMPYGVIGMCPHCSAQARQFIIPPVAHKYLTHPPIVQIWDRGRKILEQAKLILIIGYSFSDADDYIAKMLVKSVGQNPEKSIIVVDTDKQAIKRCETFIKLHVESFDEKKHFFPLQGDGVEIVPQIIEALNKATNKKMKKKKTNSKTTEPVKQTTS